MNDGRPPDPPAASSAAPASEAKPKNRILAAVLGVVAPGYGQVFVGRTLRGLAWAAAPVVLFLVYVVASRELSPFRAFAALGVSVLVGYVGAILDVLVMSPRKHRPTSIAAMIAFAVAPILLSPLVAFGLRVFVVEAFKVPSGAMIPTIAPGDHLFVDKKVYRSRPPRRGEVFVFAYPEHPEQDFIKRAIAVGSDRLEVRDGHPIINGWQVPSCLVGDYRYTDAFDPDAAPHEGQLFLEFLEESAYLTFFDKSAPRTEYQGPYEVLSGETWVMGDNRNNSHDSRTWNAGRGGGVPASHVKGRARQLWLTPRASAQGSDLAADPIAPSPELAAPLAACLARRPKVAAATPPSR